MANVIEKDDWRLDMYNNDLNGKTFEYKKFVTEGLNDHEHCAFCMQKITDLDIPEADKYGYCATEVEPQHAGWVCKDCFDDFAEVGDYHLKNSEEK